MTGALLPPNGAWVQIADQVSEQPKQRMETVTGRHWTGRLLGAAAGAAVIALGSAAPALATEGTSINGSGSALQAEAQQSLWIPGWEARTELTGAPSVTYHPTFNKEGLKEFGNLTGSLKAGALGLDAYAATDDSPTVAQIAEAESASGSTEITMPVAQEPVVVVLSLPYGISDVEHDGAPASSIDLTNELLADVWDEALPASAAPAYEANTWGALLTDAGYTFTSAKKAGGTKTIKLIASKGGSGTNYAFKQYLSQLTPTYSGYVNDEGTWPVAVGGGGASSATAAQKVARTPGTIGYAYLTDAVAGANGGFSATPTASTFSGSESHLIAYALVQDNGTATSGAIFAAPQKTGEAGVEANVDVYYNIRTAGNYGKVGYWVDPETANGSWTGTYASDPDVYSDSETDEAYYPIVAVTYDVAWGTYATSQLERHYGGSASSAGLVGNTTYDYLSSVYGHGQTAVETGSYAPVALVPLYSASAHQLSAVNGGS